ncbi:hypothetical protein ACNKHT_16485 [Shigella flexneri]
MAIACLLALLLGALMGNARRGAARVFNVPNFVADTGVVERPARNGAVHDQRTASAD